MYKEIKGNLITLAKDGHFDVIAHGCNCFCRMGAGIAPQMAKAFGCNEPSKYPLENPYYSGDINKLGQIQYHGQLVSRNGSENNSRKLQVVNAYTQYKYADMNKKPLDYEAFTMCMRKMAMRFEGKHIGLPMIGAGLAGGDWNRLKKIIQDEFKNTNVTVVIYDGK